MHALLYGGESMIWRENDRSRIRTVQMYNLRGLSGIRRMDRVPNAPIKEMCTVMKDVDGRIDESVLRWFGHTERMENDRIAKGAYVGECVSSHLVSQPRNKYID